MKILKIGDSGTEVLALQKALIKKGISLVTDGFFGSRTEQGVKLFQKTYKLVQDGIVGEKTAAALGLITLDPNPKVKPVVDDSGILKGVDLYHDDVVTNWKDMAQGGISFCFLKASQGVSIKDNKFYSYWNAAKAVGIKVGAYHFMNFEQSGKVQAHFFNERLRDVGGLKTSDLPPVIDWEYKEGITAKKADIQIGKDFIDEISILTGRRPIIYLPPSVANELGNPSWFKAYPLWLANYSSKPHVPAPWTDFTIWQNSENATIPGLGNKGDSDIFKGTLADLDKL